jgi:outer membrane receptor protein involved in Fe transport
VTLDAAVSYATWADIQADLIDAQGLPFTTNLGSGRIYGFEAQATWQITPWLRSDVATFINDSALSQPAPAFIAADERDLPNIAKSGARAALHVGTALSPAATLSFDGSVRYVGHSKLGIGAPLEIDQGGYLEGDLGARVEFAKWGISLNATNVGDVRANRFSFGNPFTVAAGRQITPLRPRSIRIGLDARF